MIRKWDQMMRRRIVFLCGAALMSAITFDGAVFGQETTPSKAKGTSAVDKGGAKAIAPANPKPADKSDAKPAANSAETKSTDQTGSAKMSVDEEAIVKTGVTFVKAYAAADAKTIAAHFTTDAEYIDEKGNTYQGREAIESVMSATFTANPGARIELDIHSIRFVSPGVAIEDGTTTMIRASGVEPIYSRYTAVQVKANGQWLCASVREHAPKERRQHRAQLQQLGWMKGDWVDEGGHSVVFFSCDAVDGGNFLLRTFQIRIAGQDAMSGSQRIGWDPVTGKLRAWTFDSEGGYTEGDWHRDGKHWVLKSQGVTADGQTASSTAIYTYVDENTMTWQSVDHEVAGVELPDSELMTVVRRAPPPQTIDEQTSKSK